MQSNTKHIFGRLIFALAYVVIAFMITGCPLVRGTGQAVRATGQGVGRTVEGVGNAVGGTAEDLAR